MAAKAADGIAKLKCKLLQCFICCTILICPAVDDSNGKSANGTTNSTKKENGDVEHDDSDDENEEVDGTPEGGAADGRHILQQKPSKMCSSIP
jgi:methionyl aminopeptidase